MKTPKVSVIMAEYNTDEKLFRSSVESITAQTYSDFEFIIIDDRGRNDVQSIVDSFHDARIKVIKNASNKGLVYSLNRAVEAAESEYVVRMDTDDEAYFDRLEKQLAFIREHPEYDVVGSRAYEYSLGKKSGVLGKSGEKSKFQIMRGDTMIHPSVIMRKNAIVKVGGYPDYRRAEDFALWCELLLQGSRFYVMSDILLKYRVDPDDYKKRRLKNRGGELSARMHYYPKLNAGPIEYMRILKSIVAGLMPVKFLRMYRRKSVLGRVKDSND